MDERLLNLTEIACELGCSVQTVNSYYRFKKENPESELAQMIPQYARRGARNTRYWTKDAVEELRRFRENIPQGCKGLLGSVTQRYVKKKASAKGCVKAEVRRGTTDGLYINKVESILYTSHVEPEVIEQVTEILRSELEWRTGLDTAV